METLQRGAIVRHAGKRIVIAAYVPGRPRYPYVGVLEAGSATYKLPKSVENNQIGCDPNHPALARAAATQLRKSLAHEPVQNAVETLGQAIKDQDWGSAETARVILLGLV